MCVSEILHHGASIRTRIHSGIYLDAHCKAYNHVGLNVVSRDATALRIHSPERQAWSQQKTTDVQRMTRCFWNQAVKPPAQTRPSSPDTCRGTPLCLVVNVPLTHCTVAQLPWYGNSLQTSVLLCHCRLSFRRACHGAHELVSHEAQELFYSCLRNRLRHQVCGDHTRVDLLRGEPA